MIYYPFNDIQRAFMYEIKDLSSTAGNVIHGVYGITYDSNSSKIIVFDQDKL